MEFYGSITPKKKTERQQNEKKKKGRAPDTTHSSRYTAFALALFTTRALRHSAGITGLSKTKTKKTTAHPKLFRRIAPSEVTAIPPTATLCSFRHRGRTTMSPRQGRGSYVTPEVRSSSLREQHDATTPNDDRLKECCSVKRYQTHRDNKKKRVTKLR